MPCYDSQNDPTVSQKISQFEIERLNKLNQNLAQLLCKAGQAYRLKIEPPVEVLAWWLMHEEFDRKRGESWKKA